MRGRLSYDTVSGMLDKLPIPSTEEERVLVWERRLKILTSARWTQEEWEEENERRVEKALRKCYEC